MMMNLNLNFIITSILMISSVSFILHFFLFYFIKIGLLGITIKNMFNFNLKENNILFIIIPFIVSFLVFYYIGKNYIYLEDKPLTVTTIANVGNTEVVLTGEFIKLVFTQFGAATVFSASAKIAASLVAKSKMGLLPKIGTIGGTSVGFTTSYLVLTQHLPSLVDTAAKIPTDGAKARILVEIKDIKTLTGETAAKDKAKEVLSKWLDPSDPLCKNKICNYTHKITENNHEIIANNEQVSQVISEMSKTDPNWADKFFTINSPLEKSEILNIPLVRAIIDIISSNLVLQFIILYLLIMVVIIFSTKVIVENKINFDNLLNYRLGKYPHKLITLYVNIWKNSANIWIYYILFCLIFFNCISIYSLYYILSVTQ